MVRVFKIDRVIAASRAAFALDLDVALMCGSQNQIIGAQSQECIWSGSASAPPSNCTRGQTHVICQNRTMTRNDVLVWLSLAGLFAAYCATFWVFFPLGD